MGTGGTQRQDLPASCILGSQSLAEHARVVSLSDELPVPFYPYCVDQKPSGIPLRLTQFNRSAEATLTDNLFGQNAGRPEMSPSRLASKEVGYDAVSLDDEERAMLPSLPERPGSAKTACYALRTYLLVSCNIFLFFFSVALIAAANQKHCSAIGRNDLLKAINSYSPLLDAIEIPMSTAVINVSASEVMSSVYTGPPSPEIDAAWDLLGNLDPVAITADEVFALGKDLSVAARWPEAFGFGSKAYIAAPNAMHHIHCLDWIRRDLDFDKYYGKRFPDGKRPKLHRFHTEHCLYVLLKQLTCRPSTEMFVFEWVEGNLAPLPDFNVREKCIDFDAILSWHNSSSRPRKDMLALRAPEGQTRLPMTDDIKNVIELTGKSSGHEA